MNYWKQFAEMLGLELEQEFELIDQDSKIKYRDTYKVTENGIYYKSGKEDDWLDEPTNTVDELLSGEYEVVPKPWKPKKGDIYWCYSEAFKEENAAKWEGKFIDFLLWKCGNCFKTAEEARTKGKEIMEQTKKEFVES
nr:MAG TPA: hypothetical protein [Caudoviricetes sp.]